MGEEAVKNKGKFVSVRLDRCTYEYFKYRYDEINRFQLSMTKVLNFRIIDSVGTWEEFLEYRKAYEAGTELPDYSKKVAEETTLRKAADFEVKKEEYKDPFLDGPVRNDPAPDSYAEEDSPELTEVKAAFSPDATE